MNKIIFLSSLEMKNIMGGVVPPPDVNTGPGEACASEITEQAPNVPIPEQCLAWDSDYSVNGKLWYNGIHPIIKPC